MEVALHVIKWRAWDLVGVMSYELGCECLACALLASNEPL